MSLNMLSDDRTPNAISHTALIVAAKRAIEHQRSDRLFDDPFAALLAADEIPVLLERWQKVGDDLAKIKAKRTRFIAVRTRFYDDFLMSAQLLAPQVVILGADFVSVKSVEIGEKARESDRGRVLRHWQFGSDRPEDLLLNYGWDATVVQPGGDGANFGRYSDYPPSRDVPGTRQVFLVTAKKN